MVMVRNSLHSVRQQPNLGQIGRTIAGFDDEVADPKPARPR
jgi:hypothetical protein